MHQKDNFENDGAAGLLADLPLTNEQAEANKAGVVVRNKQVLELNTISENINRTAMQDTEKGITGMFA